VPPVSTSASGEANFFVSKNGKEVRYTIYVHDLRDATMAHLHLGMVGANGEPIVWLFLSAQPPKEITGVFSGTLSEGTFTADNLIGLFKGKSIEDLTKEIKSGGVYINVHTKAYPDGEIRGQLHELAGSSK